MALSEPQASWCFDGLHTNSARAKYRASSSQTMSVGIVHAIAAYDGRVKYLALE